MVFFRWRAILSIEQCFLKAFLLLPLAGWNKLVKASSRLSGVFLLELASNDGVVVNAT